MNERNLCVTLLKYYIIIIFPYVNSLANITVYSWFSTWNCTYLGICHRYCFIGTLHKPRRCRYWYYLHIMLFYRTHIIVLFVVFPMQYYCLILNNCIQPVTAWEITRFVFLLPEWHKRVSIQKIHTTYTNIILFH